MADNYLTISEAEKLTSKSRSTLRRFVERIASSDDAPNRSLLLPTPDEIRSLKEQRQPFSWKMARELLEREFPATRDAEKGTQPHTGAADGNRIISILEKTVTVLEEELTQKNKQIAAFQERQREHNVLIQQLQERVSLAAQAGDSSPAAETDQAGVVVRHTDQDRGSRQKAEPQSRKYQIPFRWLFTR